MQPFVDLVLFTKKKSNKLLQIDFIRFGITGFIGFSINFVSLTLLYKIYKLEIVLAQLIAGEIALLAVFMLHNYWTYSGHQHISFLKKLFNFHLTQWSGQLIILAIVSIGVKELKLNYAISLVIASFVVMLWNFCWTKYYVFRSKK